MICMILSTVGFLFMIAGVLSADTSIETMVIMMVAGLMLLFVAAIIDRNYTHEQ